jgi:uncharacterized protein
MTQENLPLLDLFLQLRSAGLPLSIDDYQLALQALQAGFGFPDRQNLFNLCRTLWVKSLEQEQLLETCFEQILSRSTSSPFLPDREPIILPPEPIQPPPEKPKPTPTPQPNFVNVPIVVSTPAIEPETETKVATAIAKLTPDKPLDYNYSADGYYPPNLRQMQQNWAALRRPGKSAPTC